MRMKTVSGQDCRRFVQSKVPFRNNSKSLWGSWQTAEDGDTLYVVCSYRPSWPLYVYSSKLAKWFRNEDKYSVTTSKHASQSHPLEDTYSLSSRVIHDLTIIGGKSFAAKYLAGEV